MQQISWLFRNWSFAGIAFGVALMIVGMASAGPIDITSDDRVMGSADAPVTVIEYASLTCPHCATFHADTLPTLKSDYVDTGKVRLVYRDFPLDRIALSAAVLARCSGPERYFGFLGMLFKAQANWRQAKDPMIALKQISRLGGLRGETIDACLADKELVKRVVAERFDAEKAFDINSTPSFIINGKKYSGALTVEQVKAIIDPLLK